MSLQDTNLILEVGKLPISFRGTPQQFLDEFVRRTKIVSPTGTNFIFIGDVEPTSNVGPWLKNGTQWFVFDTETKRYIPLDISQSETHWYWVGPDVPPNSTPALWLKTFAGGTTDAPNPGQPQGFYQFNGTAWIPVDGTTLSGPTTSRPSAPFDLQRYYDEDIGVEIWWERGAWRTVAGTPGDVKHTIIQIATEALRFNPGWALLGAANAQIRGRYISQATKDPGANPQTDLTTAAGVAHRAAAETFGETDTLVIGPSAVPYPPTVAYWTLVKE